MKGNGLWLGLAGTIGATLSWGGMFPVLGIMLQYLDPTYLMAVRYLAAGAILLAIVIGREGADALRFEGRGRLLLFLGLGGICAFNLLIVEGVRLSGPSHGALIMATTPLLAVFVTWALERRRPEGRTVLFISLAFAGVALVVTRGSFETLLQGSGVGDLLILCGALLWAAYTVFTPRFADWSPLRFSALTASIGGVGIVVVTAVLTRLHLARVPSAHDLVVTAPGMAYIVLMGVVFAIVAWNVGVKYLGAQRAVIFMNAVPITTFTIEVLLGKHFTLVEYAGAALTIAALVGNSVFAAPVERRAGTSNLGVAVEPV
ncbi:MAG: DMT family transporter [Candidatus Velthaea sp.]